MTLPDYHVHTSYSPDSKMDPEEAVCAAIASGVTEISALQSIWIWDIIWRCMTEFRILRVWMKQFFG